MAKLELENLDDEVKRLLSENKTFLIKTSLNYKEILPADECVMQDSLFSWKFGILPNHPEHIRERAYSCECGESYGILKDGEECPHCLSIVVKKEFKTDQMAYIPIPERLLTPEACLFLSKMMSKDMMNRLVTDKLPFNDLYTEYEDILRYCVKKKDQITQNKLQFALENKEYFFSRYIPVISFKMRFMNISDNMGITKIDTHEVNTPYVQLASIANLWKMSTEEYSPLRTRKLKYDALQLIHKLHEILIHAYAAGKGKAIRSDVYATRMPYTSISVLTPLTHYYQQDSCTIGIDTFRSLFKNDIKKILLDKYTDDLFYVNRILRIDTNLSDDDKALLKRVFKDMGDTYIYINRQPTIAWGSILVIRVREIRDELVLRLHPNLFARLRADCDGDIIIMVFLAEEIREAFRRKLGTTYHHINYNCKFNREDILKNDIQILSSLILHDEEEVVVIE